MLEILTVDLRRSLDNKWVMFLSAEFEDDPDLYVMKPIKYVGIEVWQVGFDKKSYLGFTL